MKSLVAICSCLLLLVSPFVSAQATKGTLSIQAVDENGNPLKEGIIPFTYIICEGDLTDCTPAIPGETNNDGSYTTTVDVGTRAQPAVAITSFKGSPIEDNADGNCNSPSASSFQFVFSFKIGEVGGRIVCQNN